MQSLQGRKARLVLLCILCALTLWRVSHIPKQESHEIVLKRGGSSRGSDGKVLGNPENAASDFRRLYVCFNVYQKRHNGRHPGSLIDIVNDVASAKEQYGFTTMDQVAQLLANPDTRFLSDPNLRRLNPCVYEVRDKRFNGQPVGSPRPNGQRDALTWTSLYYFENAQINWGDVNSSTMNPAGFYLVLWDDGQIEKVPFSKTLWVPQGSNNWVVAFPGQAGLPKSAKTFDEFNRNNVNYQNWKRGQAKQGKENLAKSLQ